MKKRWAAFAAAILIGISCLGCTPARQDPETLLAPETAREIFQAYEEEIRGIEAACGTEIRDYTEQTREILARAAMDSYGTDSFARLSQLVTDLTAAAWNQDGEGESGDPPAYTVAKPFGPLKGASFWEVPPGVSLSGNLSGLVEVSPGELVGDLEISEAVSVEIPLERADGPADGTHLSNGKKATHRIFTGVLWGVILAGPGESEYRVACPLGAGSVHLAQIASPTCVERAGSRDVAVCESFLEFKRALSSHPDWFL